MYVRKSPGGSIHNQLHMYPSEPRRSPDLFIRRIIETSLHIGPPERRSSPQSPSLSMFICTMMSRQYPLHICPLEPCCIQTDFDNKTMTESIADMSFRAYALQASFLNRINTDSNAHLFVRAQLYPERFCSQNHCSIS